MSVLHGMAWDNPAGSVRSGHFRPLLVFDGVLGILQKAHRNVDTVAIYSSYGGHLEIIPCTICIIGITFSAEDETPFPLVRACRPG